MLDTLPSEVTLIVLSLLPIPSLLSLHVLSRQWLDFFNGNQSAIFHSAALLHDLIQPGTFSLEDALSVKSDSPWTRSTSWKDFCHRSFQLRNNWEGKGRAVVRVLAPPRSNDYHIKVDEKAGICITTHYWGGLTVTHLFSGIVLWHLPKSQVRTCSPSRYDNGYLIFFSSHEDLSMDIWRLASDFSSEGEVAAHSPPDSERMIASARAAEVYHHYAPRGHFRPWAFVRFPGIRFMAIELRYPTVMCVSDERACFYDIRTCSLVQTIDLRLRNLQCIDVNERHIFMRRADVVHVLSRESGSEILRIPTDVPVRYSQLVEDPSLIPGDWVITPLSLSSPELDAIHRLNFRDFSVSRDGRDLVILSKSKALVLFIQDFERICRGETTFNLAGLILRIPMVGRFVGFEDGHVCLATAEGLYIFTFGPDLSAKAVFVRLIKTRLYNPIPNMHVTDRRIYIAWKDAMLQENIPLFEDVENAQDLPPPPITPALTIDYEVPPDLEQQYSSLLEHHSLGCIDFSLMPEVHASEFLNLNKISGPGSNDSGGVIIV